MRKGIDRGLSQERSEELLIQDGLWKLRSGQAASARVSLEGALELNPADVRGLSALRQSYIVQKDTSTALQKVKEYAARQPKSAPVQDFLGTLLLVQGDRTGARKAFEAAKAADPRSLEPNLALVQVDVVEGKLDEGRKRLYTLVASGNKSPNVLLWLGNLELAKGNHPGAIELFRKVIEAEPDNAQALNNLAYLLAEHGEQREQALKYAQRAVELAPSHLEYTDTLGWILYHKGLYSAAIPYLERAGAAKGSVVWKYHLAMAYAKAGKPIQGRAALEEALRIDPHVPEANPAKELFNRAR
jgi:Tfp pilus assembly protein PilF